MIFINFNLLSAGFFNFVKMVSMDSLIKQIFNIENSKQFNQICLKVFNFQYNENQIYNKYCQELNIKPEHTEHYTQIPFLPIEFFKTHKVVCGSKPIQTIFKSSGTSGMNRSTHFINDSSLYEQNLLQTFTEFYGSPENYTILALLPSYLEQKESSLVYMVNCLMEKSKSKYNGFYLYNHKDLFKILNELEEKKTKVLLIGVSFALIDFFEAYKADLKYTTIIETGGMKGRKKEIIKEELQSVLKSLSGTDNVHSEYGMTEILSQAYSTDGIQFKTSNRLKVLIRETNDPFSYLVEGKTGGINIIDLANLYSCSFIETKDLGKTAKDNSFEVLGRFDHSDIRGCNLMVV